MAQTPEGKVKAAVKKRLIEYGLVPLSQVQNDVPDLEGFFFMPVAGPYSVHGIHDFVGCWKGIFWSIETKAPDNPDDHTPAQERFCKAVMNSGGISFTGVRDETVVDELARMVMDRHLVREG
jgi:hypothetical protein